MSQADRAAIAAYLANGGTITVCPTRFAAPSQACARRNPFRR